MSTDRATSPCNKFQANIFNKSKCQNCFKPRELHLLNDHDMEQVRPIYGGWLCLAPEGTDFENPAQRSRKWQRRFFILYEDGSLSFALDELPSTLPQGTMNLNQCSEVSDAETRTGQRNALCITTSQQEVFIRGDSKEIISGWSEQLSVFLRTNKQNQKKKRKVEPVTSQEPSPAKMAATDQSFLLSESPVESRSGDCSPSLSPVFSDPERLCDPDCALDLLNSRNVDADRSNIRTNNQNQDRTLERKPHEGLMENLPGSEGQEDGAAVSRRSRRESRTNKREKLQSCGDINQLREPPPQRRARSLDRRTTDTVITPDLLNFKKGWLVRLDESEQSKKCWFVLSTNSLRFYKDSLAEESSDLEGEINLTKCFRVAEFEVQRNYGFQIHTPEGVFTLSAMTAGIRRSWIQALMRNVHPVNTPDVTRPDLTLDSSSAERDADTKSNTVKQRRKEGRYRTFDWAGFKSQNSDLQSERGQDSAIQTNESVSSEEKRRSRDERRRKYENILGFSLSPESQKRTEEEMEECWRKVETILFRPENSVSVFPESHECEELLEQCRAEVEDLKARLEESERLRLKLEDQLREEANDQLEPALSSDAGFSRASEAHEEIKDKSETRRESTKSSPVKALSPPRILLHDAEGNLSELLHTDTTPPPSPPPSSPLEEPTESLVDVKTNLQTDQDEFSENSESRIIDQPVETDEAHSNILVEHHLPQDQELLMMLTQEVQLLLGEKDALNQRNQELLHQLTEANFETERLRAELNRKFTETQQPPGEEEKVGRFWVEDLQVELSMRSQELLEAQTLIASLEESLRETGELLQMNNTAEKGEELKEDGEEKGGHSDGRFEELQPSQSEEPCEDLKTENVEIEALHHQPGEEVEPDVEGRGHTEGQDSIVLCFDEGQIQREMEQMLIRMKALDRFLELMDEVDVSLDDAVEPTMQSQLKKEEEFLSAVISKLESNHFEEKLFREVMGEIIVEKKMLLLGLSLIPEAESHSEKDKDVLTCLNVLWRENKGKDFEIKHLRDLVQMKMSLLNLLASSISSSTLDRLQQTAQRRSDSQRLNSGLILSAASEALSCCFQYKVEKKIKENKEPLPTSPFLCTNCANMMKENQELRETLSNEEDEESPSQSEFMDTSCQTEEAQTQDFNTKSQTVHEDKFSQTDEEEFAEVSPSCDKDDETMEEKSERDDSTVTSQNSGTDEVLLLRGRVEELEEQLSITEEMRARFDGKLSSVQAQHERDMEKLKATCKLGLASMEESHLKVVEELQRRHQQEVERLLMERDRLLEEESAATATAIEAIKSAHRMELQREEQRRRQCENSSGNALLEEIYRRHREELASCQRELQVLSQQFSLRCLEVGHLVQALEAERKALSVCQQENQHLRTRNQELSAHLAAEISRLCSQVKQGEDPQCRRMDVYEMEITLRVKESEVLSLKQETTTLKDELQTAQRDKRNATRKYKEMFTELSILRAKTEQETDELRENLRLAHRALDQNTS